MRALGLSIGAVLLLACGACSLLLDHNAAQCQTDADCSAFGGHPFCKAGACVETGLGPTGCFFGEPTQSGEFLNQCSTAQCLAFDNCQRIEACGSTVDQALQVPPDAAAPSSPSSPSDGGASASDGGDTVLPLCADAADGRAQPLYITGSSNFPPLLKKLAPLIVATGYTPVFQITSSCNGVKTIFSTKDGEQYIVDPSPSPAAKYAAYFSADGTSTPCSLGPSGAHVDIGESDIFSSTCTGFGPPSNGIGEFFGPIQAMEFVVPGKSQQSAISAEAARAVFGAGGKNAMPWTDPSLYFIRNSGTGTQQMIGHAIGVPAASFWGVDRGTATNVDSLLKVISDPTTAERAIGIISSDFYDSDRANLKALAFKATAQSCAYLPDSTEFKKDKQNVRDGHYPIWGPLHFFTPVSEGVPTSAAAQAFVSIVSVPSIPKALLDAFIGSSLVPSCAMQVQRNEELGTLGSYSPPFQCGCYFDASVSGAAPSSCKQCNTANDCGDASRPACNLGYCEVQ